MHQNRAPVQKDGPARAHAEGLRDFAAGTPQETASQQYVNALKRSAEPLSAD